jgi:hypothetical protein
MKRIIIDTHDGDGKRIGYAVLDLPDDFGDGDLFPAPSQSESYFSTIEEAREELRQRATGKKPCECGCGRYPKGAASRFLPGHDLKRAYQDRPDKG